MGRGSSSEGVQALTDAIGYTFRDGGLLRQALAHRSWCAENERLESNERLEFLGDAVLGWVIADIVFDRFDDVPEGQLTDLRKSVVNAGAFRVGYYLSGNPLISTNDILIGSRMISALSVGDSSTGNKRRGLQ